MIHVRKIVTVYALLMVVVSCYFFPFEFTFLPKGINTKMMLAVCGVMFLCLHALRTSSVYINKRLLWASLIVLVFCLVCFFAVDNNNTDDYSYALYVFSFGTWLGGAYATFSILRLYHNKVTFRVIMNYLIVVCVLQCVLALIIDLSEPIKDIVDTYISQATIAENDLLESIDRLYGIGATLDVAGVRFSIVLLGLSVLVCRDHEIRDHRMLMVLYLFAFMVISIVGNIISRTTLVGMSMALFYFLIKTGSLIQIRKENIRFWWVVLLVGGIALVVAVYFYNNDEYFYSQLRYGFEGFFNWVEKGEWRTDSTDRLNSVMWIWPTDTRTWLGGTGIFKQFLGTDIGYCRFVLYAGLPALVVFSLFFVYNAFALIPKMGRYRDFCLGLLVLGFIIWLKVATDLYIMYALLYCIDEEREVEE